MILLKKVTLNLRIRMKMMNKLFLPGVETKSLSSTVKVWEEKLYRKDEDGYALELCLKVNSERKNGLNKQFSLVRKKWVQSGISPSNI